MACFSRDATLVTCILFISITLISRKTAILLLLPTAPPFLHHHVAAVTAVKAAIILLIYGAIARMMLLRIRLHKHDVFLVDYACYRPPDVLRAPYSTFLELSSLNGISKDNVDFQRKILQHSGLGQQTALPPSYHFVPSRKGMSYSHAESQAIFFSLVDELFAKTSIEPSKIHILVLNCCLFYPSPSLSAMIVNRYKLRSDIKTFNLSGMGCAASLLAVDMVRHLFETHPESHALILSSENLSGRDYLGARRSMLIANCLFRMGGAAILLSNSSTYKRRSKYKLFTTVRTHTGFDDKSFSCITHGEDESGNIGISLSKDLMSVAGDALTRNMTILGRDVLPFSEKLRYAINVVARKAFGAKVEAYTPDFKRAFRHFCIHAGGKAVIQEMEKQLRLTEEMTEPSRMTLHRFGNTSSTSVWYELAYLEAMEKVKGGERVWQVALGSGFKCFSAVWEAVRDARCEPSNSWTDCREKYPMAIPDCVEI